MYSKPPFSSIEEKNLKEIYTESQDLLYRFKRVGDIKEQMLKLRRARKKIYSEVSDLMNAYLQERGKRVFYKMTREGKKIKINGKKLVINPKSSKICYDEESFAEASKSLYEILKEKYSEKIASEERERLLKAARWQVREQRLPAIFFLADESHAIFPLLSRDWYKKCKKLCCKLDNVNENMEKLKSESKDTNVDLEKCKVLLSKIGEEQRKIGQEHQFVKWLHEETKETINVLQKKYEERKTKLQPKIRDLMKEGVALDTLIRWYVEDPETIDEIATSKPAIRNYVYDNGMIQLIQTDMTLGQLDQAIKVLSRKNDQLERDLKTMEGLAKELVQVVSP